MLTAPAPDILPLLSRGRHRRPAKGACFMELASVLAGERWTDHPACTHPLLGELARMVNDASSDDHRSELAVLVPSVVGLRGGGIRWTVGFTSAVAAHAVTRAAEHSQRVLCVGLLVAQDLAEVLGPPIPGTEGVAAALADVPAEAAWARSFRGSLPARRREFTRFTAPTLVRTAVEGVAEAAGRDRDGALRGLLEVGVGAARRLQEIEPVTPEPAEVPARRGLSRLVRR